MLKASESRWMVRTGADGTPNGLPSNRTEKFRIRRLMPRGTGRLRRERLPDIRRHGIDNTSARRFGASVVTLLRTAKRVCRMAN